MLARAACEQGVRGRILELCAGPALAGIAAAARTGAHLTTVDVSRRAVLNARINARLNGVAIDARRGDLFDAVAGERFDLILANPPYVPGPPPPDHGAARATDADADGRALLDRICERAPWHLNPGGSVLLVHSEVCDSDATLTALADRGLDVDVVQRHRGPLGPLLSERRADLEARGQLAPGQQFEDVLVLRGRQVGMTSARWPIPTP
jgi:release factor glutamine methyltransferase